MGLKSLQHFMSELLTFESFSGYNTETDPHGVFIYCVIAICFTSLPCIRPKCSHFSETSGLCLEFLMRNLSEMIRCFLLPSGPQSLAALVYRTFHCKSVKFQSRLPNTPRTDVRRDDRRLTKTSVNHRAEWEQTQHKHYMK